MCGLGEEKIKEKGKHRIGIIEKNLKLFFELPINKHFSNSSKMLEISLS